MFKFLKNKSNQRGIGGDGENQAVKFLKKNNYEIIELNWYNKKGKRLGEIDIIAKKNETLIFIEVKSRILNEKDDILPEFQVTPKKLAKIQKVSQKYISENNLWNLNCRFDVISIIFLKENEEIKINHIKNVFY